MTAAEARSDRGAIARSVHLVRVLPSARRARVEAALGQAAALGKRLTAPRAEAVFGQLRANDDYFARHGLPRGGTDITDADGIVYRYFAGRCFEFHPLANLSALNAHATAKDVAATERLAKALLARAVPRSGGVAWEYYFPYGGGRAPWVSGMAQAVAAQAFSRAAALVADESTRLSHEAAVAFATVPRLTTRVAAGPWIRLYSFSSIAVLNAQLQSVLSLETYAKVSDDSAAATLATQMEQTAAASLSRFDTGYWTYYSLGGGPTPLSYQKFIVQLLHRLAPDDARFADAAARFAAYLRQPPGFKLASASGGTLRFWLSKPASVSASTSAGRTVRLGLHAGWHTLRWREPKRAGFYAIHVTAVDWAGNRASFTALPIVHAATSGRPSTGAPRPSGAGGPTVTSPVATGVGIDDSGQATLAGSLGLRLVRMTVAWQPGQTAPDPAVVHSLQGLPSDVELALELDAEQLPTDDAGRTALADYAASLAEQTPALRDLVLTPAPFRELAARYANALSAVGTAVGSVRTDVAFGPFLDGSTPKPQSTALVLARQLAQDGAQPGLVSFLPAPVPGAGVWAVGDLGSLESTLAKELGKT
ncbi:MAG TPA: D-glucuronyl C5-epimerase family protein, partial [Gaiellaceae bacterium]